MAGDARETNGNGADIDLKLAGQEVKLKNVKSLNTLATVATLIVACVLGYAFYVHAGETKDASKELVLALREMAQAAREQNCLISVPIERRDPELCRRLSR
jgi:hypothetical protein